MVVEHIRYEVEQGLRRAPHHESSAAVRPFFDDIREVEHDGARLSSAERPR